jgi:hypothetical protein
MSKRTFTESPEGLIPLRSNNSDCPLEKRSRMESAL